MSQYVLLNEMMMEKADEERNLFRDLNPAYSRVTREKLELVSKSASKIWLNECLLFAVQSRPQESGEEWQQILAHRERQ